jgi:hypothetical protein
MNKKLHSLLFSIGFLIPIEEENGIEKSNSNPEIISLKSNYIPNFFKYQLEARINSHNKLIKYREYRNCNNSKTYFQKITNNIDHLLNEIILNLNHQNRVSQPT